MTDEVRRIHPELPSPIEQEDGMPYAGSAVRNLGKSGLLGFIARPFRAVSDLLGEMSEAMGAPGSSYHEEDQ